MRSKTGSPTGAVKTDPPTPPKNCRVPDSPEPWSVSVSSKLNAGVVSVSETMGTSVISAVVSTVSVANGTITPPNPGSNGPGPLTGTTFRLADPIPTGGGVVVAVTDG